VAATADVVSSGLERLQAGERAAIILAEFIKAELILLDEKAARRCSPALLKTTLDRDRKPPPGPGTLYTAGFSLPADLDTGPGSAATAGASAATVRDKLYPKCAFSLVVRGAAGAAQCIHAGLCGARGRAGVSR
jgi:hypothetical protein